MPKRIIFGIFIFISVSMLFAQVANERTNDVIFYTLENPTLHGFDLTWSESIDNDFSYYEVRRSTSAGVSAGSTLVDSIAVQGQLSCTDTSADIGTTYYYKLFVVNVAGERSPGSNELSGTTLRMTFPFTDDFEGDLTNWDYDEPWGLTGETSHGGDQCMADSPYLLYGHNLNITLRTAVDLSEAERPMLSYWQRYNIDTADYGYVEVSTDGGSNWTLLIQLTGAQLEWQQKNLDLSSYTGMDNLKIRFRFYTNANTPQDGWFIDDVQIIENETEIAYPFFDQMDDEGTFLNWMNTGYWDWQEDGGYEGGCWHDSPNGNSPNYDTNITLAGPVSFSGITSPQLSFWHKYNFYYHGSQSSYRDYGYVQISVDDGQTWTNVGGAYQNYSSGWPDQWHHVQIDLSPYGGEDALIRFYIDDRFSSSQDGWYIDEVAIQDQPAASILQMPSDIGLHTLQLNWTANTTANFNRYEIYRRTSSGISTTNSELIATITDPQQMNYTDTGLEISRTYYYKVYQVNTGNIFDSGSNEVSAVTEDIGYPFTENFEGDDINWDLQGDWAFAADDAYTGSYSLTDSPGGLHQNNLDIWAKTGIDLSDAVNPQLSFYQHYHFGEGDYGYIYISTDNETSWFTADQFMLSDLEWSEYKLNLSPWAGYSSVRIGFKLYSNSLNVQDGWYIDDLVIDENPQIIEFPFYDAMDDESSSINWNPSLQWSRMIDGGYEGGCWHDSPDGNSPNIDTQLILAGPISFAGITSPQLSFWHKYHFFYSTNSNYRDYGYVQISVDNGHTWATIGGAYQNQSSGWPDEWQHVQLDISTYGGEDVYIRFYIDDRYPDSRDGWYIDEVAIQDQPAAAMLNPISNIQKHSVQLDWIASPNSGFDRYEIYRSTSSGLTNINSEIVATFNDPADSSYIDTGLEIGRTYYYRIYVVNDGDIYDPGSNEQSATTLNLNYPYFEDCEGTTGNWDFDETWAFSDDDAYSGDYSLTDSPGTLHSNDQDIWVKTGIDLSQALNPQLSFWQHYHFGEGDYGQIYISSNNESSWTLADQFSGADLQWKEYKFNLSPWIGVANLRIGFKFHSNSLNVQDGWYLDDISIAENAETIAFPFYDAMDDELSRENWNSTFYWDRLEDGGYEGGCWHDSPNGNSPNLDTQLILSAPVSFAGITSPQLSFWHKYHFYYGNHSNYRDYGYVQISTDMGHSWTSIGGAYQNQSSGWPDEWLHVQIDISAYGGEDVLIRFFIDERYGYSQDGWYIDEVAIQDQPPASMLAPVSNITMHSMQLDWAANPNSGFDRYEIYRKTSSGVTNTNSELVTTLTNPADSTYTINDLEIGKTYYYKMYVVNAGEIYDTGSNEMSATTLNLSYPFWEDFEGSDINWDFGGTWAFADDDAYSGDMSLTDSPGSLHGNNQDMWIKTGIDLSEAVNPQLSYFTRYHFGTGDFGEIYISTNNDANWTLIDQFTGASLQWEEYKISLSSWKGNSQVRLGFRFYSNNLNVQDGWYIDDLAIDENDQITGFPFFDAMDSAASENNWNSTYRWAWMEEGGYSGGCWHDSPDGISPGVDTQMNLAGPISFAGITSPQLSFWHKYDFYYYNSSNRDIGYVYISTDYGQNWTTLTYFQNTSANFPDEWQHVQLDLSAYGGEEVLIRYEVNEYYGTQGDGWYIDEVAIWEQMPTVPDFVQLESPAAVYATMGFPTCNIYGLVYEPEVTDGVGQGELVIAELGFGADGSYPGDNWSWTEAIYLEDSEDGEMDRYVGSLTVIEPGAFDYAFRFSTTDGENWVYADLDGNMAGQGTTNFYTPDQAGALAVADAPEVTINLQEVNITLPTGRSGNRAFNIGNQGLGTLGYNVETTGNVSWLNILPVSGTVEPEEDMNVILSFCAAGLSADSIFTTELTITSNDPENSLIVLPVSMQVLESDATEFSGVVRNTVGEIIFPATIQVWSDTLLVEEMSTFTDGYFAIYGLESGEYDVRAYARNYYPKIRNDVDIPVLGLAFDLTRVFEVLPSPEQINVYSSNTIFAGSPVTAGDIITAKDTDGIICGAYQVHSNGSFGFMHIYADDPQTNAIDEGAQAGETLTFYINDFPAECTGGDDPVWTMNNAVLNIDLSAEKEDLISLNTGWNLFSFTMEPADDDITQVLASLAGNYQQVSSFDLDWGDGGDNGARTYDPDLPQFSDLLTLDPYHGYWIKLDEAAELSVSGSKFYDTTPMYLEAGWNLTSYLPEDDRAIEDGFCSIHDNLIIASGFDNGAMTYEPGSPYSDLLLLENGLGYWVNLGYFDLLDYSMRGNYEPLIIASNQTGNTNSEPFYPQTRDEVTVTPWWSDFYGEITFQDEVVPVGSQIIALDPDGIVCGEYTVSTDGLYGFMHVYGDDPATLNDEGALSGDVISFEIDGVTAEETGIWQSGNPGIISNLNLHLLDNPSDEDANETVMVTQLKGNYPNPFNPQTEIKFCLADDSHVLLEIFNLRGQKIITLANEELPADHYSFSWNGNDHNGIPVASGVYLYKLKTDDYQSVQKMLLLK